MVTSYPREVHKGAAIGSLSFPSPGIVLDFAMIVVLHQQAHKSRCPCLVVYGMGQEQPGYVYRAWVSIRASLFLYFRSLILRLNEGVIQFVSYGAKNSLKSF
jgi:hypothetical protein